MYQKQIVVRTSSSLYKMIENLSKELDITKSQTIRGILESYESRIKDYLNEDIDDEDN